MENNCGVQTLTDSLLAQGLPEVTTARELQEVAALPCQVAAPVIASDILHDSRTSRFVQFALRAGAEAMEQSQLLSWLSCTTDSERTEAADDPVVSYRRQRTGVSIGSGMSGVREIVQASRNLEEKGLRSISPHFVPKVLANSASGRLALQYGLTGPNHAPSTACAASAHALGDAFRWIQYGQADVVVAGGSEACIDPLSLAGFSRLRALSTNFPPELSSRPFDEYRDGFVMGEGAAILVLEEFEHAQSRSAPILAEVLGYGMAADAYHITAPHPEGKGAANAMSLALKDANVAASEVDYVNAHATSTPKGDEIEAAAIDQVFFNDKEAPSGRPLWVSSTKGATGHLLGGAGAIEAAFTVRSLSDGIVPATRSVGGGLIESTNKFQHVEQATLIPHMAFAMSNSFGFGGTNVSLLFGRVQ